MSKFKIGQKVTTPLGDGVVVAIGSAFNGVESYRVRFTLPKDENGYLHPIVEFPHYHLKPYKTAIEKLSEMGLKMKIANDYGGGVFSHEWYDAEGTRVLTFYVENKTITVYECPNEIMLIVPQYLEELSNAL